MKRILFGVLVLSLSACATKTSAPQLTPQARMDYNLKPVVDGIGALQLAAENATATVGQNGQPLLSMAAGRKVVQFCVDANVSLGTAGSGWCAAVSPAFIGLKNQLSAAELKAVSPYFTTFQAVLATAGCTVQ